MNNIAINSNNEKDCCGCGTCSLVCPNKAITMETVTLGHKFAFVDTELCIDCGECTSVCPMLNVIPSNNSFKQSVYAAYATDNETRKSGSSGGVICLLSEILVNTGYTVYGAAFDDKLKLKCTSASNQTQLKKLFKSKYLQSDLSDSFFHIRRLLDDGKKILFVSTPCQVIALKLFLSKEYDNLLTMDFFCHGVPSQTFFDQCMAYEGKIRNGKIIDYQFRTKVKNGTTPHYYTETIEKNDKIKSITDFYFKSPYYAFFQMYINLRESCYNCRFSGKERASDITVGDFHDIDKYISGLNRFDGVSTVVINTEKGNSLWNSGFFETSFYPLELSKLISDGVVFGGGTPRPATRDEFINDYLQMNLSDLIGKWVGPKRYIKQKIYYRMPRVMRQIMKKVTGV